MPLEVVLQRIYVLYDRLAFDYVVILPCEDDDDAKSQVGYLASTLEPSDAVTFDLYCVAVLGDHPTDTVVSPYLVCNLYDVRSVDNESCA